jgi:hypothetical protein
VTETIRESTLGRPALPHTAAAEGPPVVKGIRNGIDSILAIFMALSRSLRWSIGPDLRAKPRK